VTSAPYLKAILGKFKTEREKRNISPAQIEEKLILGPGWVDRFEKGDTVPTLDMLFAMLHVIGATLPDLMNGLDVGEAPSEIDRHIFAVPDGKDLKLHFAYGDHDAVYRLPDATTDQYESVIKTLRDGLARDAGGEDTAVKTDAVAKAFLLAVKIWPKANPSDLWWFVMGRAYCDRFNHPATSARRDLEQSWKRTGGWALEQVLVRHYGPALKKHGIRIIIGTGEQKKQVFKNLKGVVGRMEADKADVLLLGEQEIGTRFFGVVHVKASFAERRTDDVPMSKALVDAGYVSPLWTMDSKSMPGTEPINRGELGEVLSGLIDGRSAKRKDIEDDQAFSACFSYNRLTKPTPARQNAKARIQVCDFSDPDDEFTKFITAGWQSFAHK
jgi:transcriptional regulator with XRE-family HTH domain